MRSAKIVLRNSQNSTKSKLMNAPGFETLFVGDD